MSTLLQRLKQAVPAVESWIDDLLQQHASVAVPIAAQRFPKLAESFSADLLSSARAVSCDVVPVPPLSAFNVPGFADALPLGRGITYRDCFFVIRSHERNESTHFHELVHVVQWNALGARDFLLTYGVGLATHGYRDSPLEAIAFNLQEEYFDRETLFPLLEHVVTNLARESRDEAFAFLRSNGVDV